MEKHDLSINIDCLECNDTGVIDTGNNDLPCECLLGALALFNVAGVDGPVTGTEIRRHFLNGSLEPIALESDPIDAQSLPGRQMGSH